MSSEKHIDCTWVEQRVDSYLDGELPPEETGAFERHAASCPACAGELALAREVVSGLRALPTFDCPEDVVDRAAVRAGEGKTENHYVAGQSPARGWSPTRLFGGRLAGVWAMLFIIAAVATFVLTQRSGIERQYTEAEIEEAQRETMIAFAYVGKYTSRGATVLRDEVMADRVVPTMRRAIAESGNEVMKELLVPLYNAPKKDVTNDQTERSDK